MKKLFVTLILLLGVAVVFGQNYKEGDFSKKNMYAKTITIGTNAANVFTISGSAISGSLALTGNVTIGGTLGVTGAVTLTTTLLAGGDITTSSATPAYQFIDSDCTDGDVSAYVVAAATTTTTGAEDIDVTFYQQVAGTGTAFITADADGDITVGTSAQGVAVTSNLAVTGTNSSFIGTGGSANNAALKVATASGTPQIILDDVDATDAQEPMWYFQSANDAVNGVLYIGYGDRSNAITMTNKTDMIIIEPGTFTLGATTLVGDVDIYAADATFANVAGTGATFNITTVTAGTTITLDAADAAAGTANTYVSITGSTPAHGAATPTDIFLDITPTVGIPTVATNTHLVDLTFTTPAYATAVASNARGIYIAPTIGNASTGTNVVAAIDIANFGTGDAQVSAYGLRIGTITGTAATEEAIKVGEGWDYGLNITSPVTFQAGMYVAVAAVGASTYDVLATDQILSVTYTGTGAVAIDLKTAQTISGRVLVVQDAGGNAAVNNITITTQGGELINGAATFVMNGNYEAINLYCDGTNYFVY